MRPEQSHDGLNDGADDRDEAESRMRIFAEFLERLEALDGHDDDGADDGHDDRDGHQDLVKAGEKIG